jgi:hypothetical protein
LLSAHAADDPVAAAVVGHDSRHLVDDVTRLSHTEFGHVVRAESRDCDADVHQRLLALLGRDDDLFYCAFFHGSRLFRLLPGLLLQFLFDLNVLREHCAGDQDTEDNGETHTPPFA